MAKRGKADGGICVEHNEIKARNRLPCKSYVEFNNQEKMLCVYLEGLCDHFYHINAEIYH